MVLQSTLVVLQRTLVKDANTVLTMYLETGCAREHPPERGCRAGATRPARPPRCATCGVRIGASATYICWACSRYLCMDCFINDHGLCARCIRDNTDDEHVLGTLQADVSFTDDAITVDGKESKVVTGREPGAMPWKGLDVRIIIESTGACNFLEGGSERMDAGAERVAAQPQPWSHLSCELCGAQGTVGTCADCGARLCIDCLDDPPCTHCRPWGPLTSTRLAAATRGVCHNQALTKKRCYRALSLKKACLG